MTKLTEHFSLEEMSFSSAAVRHNIPNIPGEQETENLTILCSKVLEEVRKEVNTGIRILSGFRNHEVNDLVGGADNSQHMFGEAADTIAVGIPIETYYQKIKTMVKEGRLIVDQVIQEFDGWVHISFTVKRENRNQFMYAKKVNKKTVYLKDPL